MRVNILRNSSPSPNPQIRPTRVATSMPNNFDQMLLSFVACRQNDQIGGIVSPLRIRAPSATKAAMSENCARAISPLTIRSEQPTLK